MNKRVLIVEDQFVEANDLQLMLEKAGYEVCGIARSVPIAREMIVATRPGLVLLDIFLKGKLTGIDLARQLKEENTAFIFLSANSNEEILAVAKTTEPYGFIVKPFREKDLLITLEIAQYRHEHSHESKHRRQVEMISQLEQSANTHAPWADRQLLTWKVIQREIPFDFVAMCFDDPGKKEPVLSSFLRIGFNEYQSIGMNELSTITGAGKNELTRMIHQPDKKTITGYFNEDMFEEIASKRSLHALLQEKFEVQSLLSLSLTMNNGEPCSLYFYSRRADTYNADHVAMLFRLQKTFSSILEPSVVEKTNGIAKPPTAVNEIISANASGFENIIGNSHLLLNVFDQVKQVAPFDTSVLILGESGTGKERIADCIHNLSPRKGKALIKVNCAALPATLVESELFGHEKGSFTGAIDKRVGKFEQAHGGTIFLDEVGEMSVDLQVKLLRVLQEKEIEPVGGRSPVKIDVRVITATNRNLEKEVAEGRFRLDLYYRLNVFPISMPSLSERIDDIPVLVQHFINIYNRKSGKKITGIADKLLNKLMAYSWPGNIRELENLVERSVLLAKGTTIEDISLPTTLGNNSQRKAPETASKTIHENERDYIINVLKKCNGKIWGLGGAASILNVPPSTLKSKMKKLGILKVNNE